MTPFAELSLVVRNENDGDISSLNLLASPFVIARDGYVQRAGRDARDRVEEIIALHVIGASTDALATGLSTLDAMIELATRPQRQSVTPNEVWLRARLNGESQARQAYLFTLARSPELNVSNLMTWAAHALPNYQLQLIRSALWERPSSSNFAVTDVNGIGGKAAFSSIPGDMPARVMSIFFTPVVGDGEVNEFWIGARSNAKWGTAIDFQPVWNLRKASTFGADTTGGTSNPDSEAHDGYKVVCTFATTATMAPRVTISLADAVGTTAGIPLKQRGRFLVLLRSKNLGLSDQINARLGVGFSSLGVFALGERVPLSINWNHAALGEIEIPPSPLVKGNEGLLENVSLQIQLERVSGSSNVELDCLVLIPVDEGFIHIKNFFGLVVGSRYIYAHQTGDNRLNGYVLDVSAGGALESSEIQERNWSLPIGSGQLICAARRDGTVVKADDFNVNIVYYPRYASLRGSG